jgi:hypothetical protein
LPEIGRCQAYNMPEMICIPCERSGIRRPRLDLDGTTRWVFLCPDHEKSIPP